MEVPVILFIAFISRYRGILLFQCPFNTSLTLHKTVQYWFAKEYLLDNASGYIIQGGVRGDEAPKVCLTDLYMTVTWICSEFELAN